MNLTVSNLEKLLSNVGDGTLQNFECLKAIKQSNHDEFNGNFAKITKIIFTTLYSMQSMNEFKQILSNWIDLIRCVPREDKLRAYAKNLAYFKGLAKLTPSIGRADLQENVLEIFERYIGVGNWTVFLELFCFVENVEITVDRNSATVDKKVFLMNINDIIDGAVVSIQAETADFIKTNDCSIWVHVNSGPKNITLVVNNNENEMIILVETSQIESTRLKVMSEKVEWYLGLKSAPSCDTNNSFDDLREMTVTWCNVQGKFQRLSRFLEQWLPNDQINIETIMGTPLHLAGSRPDTPMRTRNSNSKLCITVSETDEEAKAPLSVAGSRPDTPMRIRKPNRALRLSISETDEETNSGNDTFIPETIDELNRFKQQSDDTFIPETIDELNRSKQQSDVVEQIFDDYQDCLTQLKTGFSSEDEDTLHRSKQDITVSTQIHSRPNVNEPSPRFRKSYNLFPIYPEAEPNEIQVISSSPIYWPEKKPVPASPVEDKLEKKIVADVKSEALKRLRSSRVPSKLHKSQISSPIKSEVPTGRSSTDNFTTTLKTEPNVSKFRTSKRKLYDVPDLTAWDNIDLTVSQYQGQRNKRGKKMNESSSNVCKESEYESSLMSLHPFDSIKSLPSAEAFKVKVQESVKCLNSLPKKRTCRTKPIFKAKEKSIIPKPSFSYREAAKTAKDTTARSNNDWLLNDYEISTIKQLDIPMDCDIGSVASPKFDSQKCSSPKQTSPNISFLTTGISPIRAIFGGDQVAPQMTDACTDESDDCILVAEEVEKIPSHTKSPVTSQNCQDSVSQSIEKIRDNLKELEAQTNKEIENLKNIVDIKAMIIQGVVERKVAEINANLNGLNFD